MHRADDLSSKATMRRNPVDSIVILSLAILRIGQPSAAPEEYRHARDRARAPSVRGTAQYSFGLAIRACSINRSPMACWTSAHWVALLWRSVNFPQRGNVPSRS